MCGTLPPATTGTRATLVETTSTSDTFTVTLSDTTDTMTWHTAKQSILLDDRQSARWHEMCATVTFDVWHRTRWNGTWHSDDKVTLTFCSMCSRFFSWSTRVSTESVSSSMASSSEPQPPPEADTRQHQALSYSVSIKAVHNFYWMIHWSVNNWHKQIFMS